MARITKAHNGAADNILAVYGQATDLEHQAGMIWYQEAYRFCEKTRNSTNALAGSSVPGVTTLDVARIAALLSPRSKWGRNQQDTFDLLMAYASESDMKAVKIATFNANKEKAIRYLLSDCPTEKSDLVGVPGESKVPTFAYCIAHYKTTHLVCVDGHAIGVWLGDRIVKAAANGPAYLRIQEDYQLAADIEGIMPHQMQAVTWLVYRRLHKIK